MSGRKISVADVHDWYDDDSAIEVWDTYAEDPITMSVEEATALAVALIQVLPPNTLYVDSFGDILLGDTPIGCV